MDGLPDVWPQGMKKLQTQKKPHRQGHAACDKTGLGMLVPGMHGIFFPQRPADMLVPWSFLCMESSPLLLDVLPLGCLHGFDGILPHVLHNRLDLLGIDANR